ncbi:MAG: Ig-like domain-containing protein [Bacteroidetes bacterium]|nr:Ig-like domain-containing protein [Bacteroidota bacterium]
MRYTIFTLLLASLLQQNCANPVSPIGGEKDTKGPEIKFSEPAYGAHESLPKEIRLTFNENIQVKQAEENIIISPRPVVKPTITHSNRQIKIQWNEALLPNTTYHVYLNQAISDLNENNPATLPPFQFHTGNKTDSIELNGKIDIVEPTANAKPTVIFQSGVHPGNYTTPIINQRFSFGNLPDSTGTLLSFDDANGNKTADSNEHVGLQRIRQISDSSVLILYPQKKISLSAKVADNLSQIRINDLYLRNHILQSYSNIYSIKDSLYTDTVTLKNIIKEYGSINAITSISYNALSIDQKIKPLSTLLYTDSGSTTSLSTPYIIKSADINKFQSSDTSNNTFPSNIQVKNDRNILSFIHTGITPFTFKILPRAIEYENGLYNKDTLRMNLAGNPAASCIFTNPNNATVIVTIEKNKEIFIAEIKPLTSITYYGIEGTYNMSYFLDTDKNHRITPPNLITNTLGEPYMKLNANLLLRRNLSNEIILRFNP